MGSGKGLKGERRRRVEVGREEGKGEWERVMANREKKEIGGYVTRLNVKGAQQIEIAGGPFFQTKEKKQEITEKKC